MFKTNELQKFALKVLMTDVIAILGISGCCTVDRRALAVAETRIGSCADCAHRGTGWAWRDMEMDVSCSWGFGRPGIG